MRFRLPLALPFALGLASVFVPAHARAQDRAPAAPLAPAPAADLPPSGARTTHIVAGAVTAGVAYGLGVGASYLFDDYRGAKELRIPVAGPWMALAKTGCPDSEPDCSPVTLVIGAALTIFGGVSQAGGLAIIGEGLFLKTSSARPAPPKAAKLTLRPVPLDFGKGGAGLGLVGTF